MRKWYRRGCCIGIGVALTAATVAVMATVRGAENVPTSLLALPIIVAAYLGGAPGGLAATATAMLGVVLFLPAHDTALAWVRPAVLLAVGIMTCIMIEGLRLSRRRAERHARDADRATRWFAQLFQASPVAKSMSRISDGVVVAANPAYLKLFGLSERDIVGRRPVDAGVVVDFGSREGMFARLRASRSIVGVEIKVATPAGPRELILWSATSDVDGELLAMSTFVDVTERNRAQREVREVESKMREVLENISEVTWLTDVATSAILYVSPAYEKVFGRSCADLYANRKDWLAVVHPDDLERAASLSLAPGSRASETRIRILRGGQAREIEISLFPVHDDEGQVVRIAGVGVDVTERRTLEEQLRQTQKLESMGLLAGGVAHDFNNVLAVINANAGLLAESLPPTGLERELIDEIESAVTRAAGLTRQLLAFSRKQVVEPAVLDLNAAVKDTRKMLRRMLGDDIVIATSLEPDLRHVRIDPGYLVQVLMNLAVNARDAMQRGGTFSLTTRNVDQDAVMIELTDTGTGMSPEVRARVFEPFFTTKSVGRGTGLGLSVVHGIIEQAGGRIEVDSALGVGTTFRIYLPACDQPLTAIADLARLAPAGSEKILLVDDDPYVRGSSARALRARGYTVIEARDGHEALRRIREHQELALLITDVVMPGMDGAELAQLARAEKPALKILMTSGYTDDSLADHGVRPEGLSFLEKPYGANVLAGRVRQIIDASAA